MNSISLCMIVKDETETLDRALKSIKSVVDEIIIVQTFPSWPTKKVCNKYKAKTYDFIWINDFSAARNFAFSKATKDYILWMDADDFWEPQEVEKLLSLKNNMDTEIDVWMMGYVVRFDENKVPLMSVQRERLVKRSKNYQWQGAVHECIAIPQTEKVAGTDIRIVHGTNRTEPNLDRNIRIYEEQIANGRLLDSRELYHYGNELFDHKRFADAIEIYEKMLQRQGQDLWIEHAISACGRCAESSNFLGNREKILYYLTKSFEYDNPRAEATCQISNYFLENKNIKLAIFWAELSTMLVKPEYSPILMENCWTWLPHAILANCFSMIGELDKAFHHNEQILKFKPTDKEVLKNKEILIEAIRQRSFQQQITEIKL
jgi:glycosyltransferase involved in cell wall biosynthesis